MDTNLNALIYSYLSTLPAITDIVGTRIYPDFGPTQPIKPYIVFSTVSSSPFQSMNGPTTLNRKRIQFDCYGWNTVSVSDLNNALITALNGKHLNIDGVQCNTFLINDLNVSDGPKDASQQALYCIKSDYNFVYRTN